MAPLALLRLRMLTLDSVSSSPCSSDFLSASVARKRSVTVSHSSGSSSNRKPTQMMQVAARRTTLKITSCFSTSIAKHKNVRKQDNGEEGQKERNDWEKSGSICFLIHLYVLLFYSHWLLRIRNSGTSVTSIAFHFLLDANNAEFKLVV